MVMQEHCAHNAISFTDYDRCGEPSQRCQCLKGFEGDGYTVCDGLFPKHLQRAKKKNFRQSFLQILK